MNNQQVKISMIEPVGGHGGMDYYDFGLCEGLSSAGVDVVLHTCEKTEQIDALDVRHTFAHVYGKDASWVRGLRYLKSSVWSVLSAVKEQRKICHFHLFYVGLVEAFNIALAKLCFRKVVITAHDVETFVESLSVPVLVRWAYAMADGVIAHNEISKSELMAKLKVPEEKIKIIPHGNYLHMLHDLPEKEASKHFFDIESDAKVILFFGQIKDVKGLDILIEAMPNVLQAYPKTILMIAGKPWKADFSMYEKKISDLGIESSCKTEIRFILDEEIPKFYAVADVIVLPYRRIYQSGVVLMSMSYGKAVVVSDLEGMTEVVSDEKTGFVFNRGNVHSLADTLKKVLGDDKLRMTVEKQGFEHVRKHYDWCEIGERTRELYEQL